MENCSSTPSKDDEGFRGVSQPSTVRSEAKTYLEYQHDGILQSPFLLPTEVKILLIAITKPASNHVEPHVKTVKILSISYLSACTLCSPIQGITASPTAQP